MHVNELFERAFSSAFQQWFAGSKVIDEHGAPLRVFHGTPYGGFETFSSTKWRGIAGYFHVDPGLSSVCAEFPWEMGDKPPAHAKGGACLYPVYLALKNPLDLSRVDGEKHLSAEEFLHLAKLKADPNSVRNPLTDQPVWSYLATPRVIELIKQHGYDGVMYNEQGPAFVAFDSGQVKSVFNRGSFDPANPNISEAWRRNLAGKWEGDKPRVFWRGTNPDTTETRRIKTGNADWDSHLFVADDPQRARSYGSRLERITAKPEAKILYQGTREFRQLAAGVKGNLLSWASTITSRAQAAGYDAVWFERQSDVGTAIINPDAFQREQSL